jgi:hypothetical protein
VLDAIGDAMVDRGRDALVLHGAAIGGPPDPEWLVRVLVRRRDAVAVRRVLEPLPWQYVIGDVGVLRAARQRVVLFPGGPAVSVMWGIPASPLPAATLRGLERALWGRPTPIRPGLLVPDDAALLVYAAVQSLRPGRLYHRFDRRLLFRLRDRGVDLDRARVIARHAGVASALRGALALSDEEAPVAPSMGIFDDPVRAAAWRVALAAQRTVVPPRLRPAFAGHLEFGKTAVRSRLAGAETVGAPPAFLPTPMTETLVDAVLAALPPRPSTLVEVGTGVGAVALGVARRRPDVDIVATELSSSALRWARRNVRRAGAPRVRLRRGSLLEPARSAPAGSVDVLVANLPYYPSASYVPLGAIERSAIQGTDADGLGLYRAMGPDAARLVRPGGSLVLQMFDEQRDVLADDLRRQGFEPGDVRARGPFVAATFTRTSAP